MTISRRALLCGSTATLFAASVRCEMFKKSRSPDPGTEIAPAPASSPAAQTQVSRIKPQQGASPLVLAKKRLAQLRADALLVWDTERWTLTTRIPLEKPQAVGTLPDGSLLAIERPAAQKGLARVHVVPPAGAARAYQGSLTTSAARAYVLPGAGADEFLLDSPDLRAHLIRYRLMPGGMVLGDDDYPLDPNDHKALAALPGGRVVLASSHGLSLVRVPGGAQHFRPADEALAIVHLAAGPGADQVWVTNPPDQLRLLALGTPVRTLQTVRTGPGSLVHMHAAGDTVAVLSVVEPDGGGAPRFTLTTYGPAGEKRWQTPVELPQPTPETFVAVGEGAVAVGGPERVQVWSLADGRPRALTPG